MREAIGCEEGSKEMRAKGVGVYIRYDTCSRVKAVLITGYIGLQQGARPGQTSALCKFLKNDKCR